MKKITKVIFAFAILLCVPLLFSGCESGMFKEYAISYVGQKYEFDEFSSAVLVEYGEVVSFSKNDFRVFRVNTKGRKQKTNKFTIDASSVNGRRLDVGEYKVFFRSTSENYEKSITIRVYEREIEKPTFASFTTEYDQNVVDIGEYLESQPGFDSTTMIVEDSESSTVRAVDVGTYRTKINLFYGCVWNTPSGRTEPIEFVWTITQKTIAKPKVKGSSVLSLELDDDFNVIPCVLEFERTSFSSLFEIKGNRTTKAGENVATVQIKNNNVVFPNGEKSATYLFFVNAKVVSDVEVLDAGEYEYSGEEISPLLSNFIPKIMEIQGEASNINAGNYTLKIAFKEKVKDSLKWTKTDEDVLEVAYQITRKSVKIPTLKINKFTFSGTAPVLEFENFDEDLFSVSDTSQNISAGWFSVTVSPKNQQVASNHAFEGTSTLGILVLEYQIEKAKVEATISWKVPDGELFTDGQTASAIVLSESGEQILAQVTLYFLSNGKYEKVDSIASAGEYRLILSFKNHILVDENGNAIDSSKLRKDFEVL